MDKGRRKKHHFIISDQILYYLDTTPPTNKTPPPIDKEDKSTGLSADKAKNNEKSSDMTKKILINTADDKNINI